MYQNVPDWIKMYKNGAKWAKCIKMQQNVSNDTKLDKIFSFLI